MIIDVKGLCEVTNHLPLTSEDVYALEKQWTDHERNNKGTVVNMM
jgi:hypothetical protein